MRSVNQGEWLCDEQCHLNIWTRMHHRDLFSCKYKSKKGKFITHFRWVWSGLHRYTRICKKTLMSWNCLEWKTEDLTSMKDSNYVIFLLSQPIKLLSSLTRSFLENSRWKVLIFLHAKRYQEITKIRYIFDGHG